MKKNRRSVAYGVIGILVLIATIIIYFLTRSSDAYISDILGFSFMIFAEVVLFAGLIGIEILSHQGSQIMIKTGCGITLVTYSTIVFITSLIYFMMDTDRVKGFCILQIILFDIAVSLFLVFFITSKSVKDSDDKILNSVVRVNEMVDSLELLKSQYKSYEKQLAKLAEDLKFTDVSTSVEVDSEIEAKIAKLELELVKKDSTDNIEGLLEDILLLIKKRKVEVGNKKVGGV